MAAAWSWRCNAHSEENQTIWVGSEGNVREASMSEQTSLSRSGQTFWLTGYNGI